MDYDEPRKLRVGVIHPDLGIGGAERLVVDVCVGLQKLGHEIEIYTMRHEKERCFSETADGTLKVSVLGSWPIPRGLPIPFTKRTIFNTPLQILRQFHLTISLICQQLAYTLHLPLLPKAKPFDVIFMDQLSTCLPLLRWLTGTRVVFYVHFPDLLLSSGRGKDIFGRSLGPPQTIGEMIRRHYRAPLDTLEETTTGEADILLSNSEFTSSIFTKTFPLLRRYPIVVYPGINTETFQDEALTKVDQASEEIQVLQSDTQHFLSINRFESKKNLGLAIAAFAQLHKSRPNLRLILAGGYDPRLPENSQVLVKLQRLADKLSLTHHTYSSIVPPSSSQGSPSISDKPNSTSSILFLLNISDAQKLHLLTSPRTISLLYTPSHEHLGIVPLESMACGLPVIAADDEGGPRETIVDSSMGMEEEGEFDVERWAETSTGFLRPPLEPVWAEAMEHMLSMTLEQRSRVAENGKRRVREKFSLESMSKSIEETLYNAVKMDGFEGSERTRPSISTESGFFGFAGAVACFWVMIAFLAFLFYPDFFPEES
ncbi:glycosyltransferase family 4 protein [Atractiella rhizophila]|nr:glycosyltransferase family 4 protein [Atractiella rhizophila]